jgi:hypothetical protein
MASQLGHLKASAGEWKTKATLLRDTVVPGRIMVEWLRGEKFLLHRARKDYPDFSDSISVIGGHRGGRGQLTLHYFRLARVFRVYRLNAGS